MIPPVYLLLYLLPNMQNEGKAEGFFRRVVRFLSY